MPQAKNMSISVKVRPNSREQRIEKMGPSEFLVRVKAPSKEGRANQAVIGLLSEYFDIPKSRITIIRGHKTRDKIINIA